MAFAIWGVLPVYWKLLGHVGSDLAIAHRVVWTMATVLALLILRRECGAFCAILTNHSQLLAHAWSALLLGVNWGIFIWASQHGHILDCSLGYFINPLLNVLIGRVLLGERLSSMQSLSIAFACFGVHLQVLLLGRFPWIGLLLAGTFALYGLARRRSSLGPLMGLGVETMVGLPFACVYLIWMQHSAVAVWGHANAPDVLLILGLGIITAVPLIGFAHAARQLPFALLGVLQFIAPTGQFLVGALLYHEPIGMSALLSFALIWTGVLLFCGDLWKRRFNP